MKKSSTWSSASCVGWPGSSTRCSVTTECAILGMPCGLPLLALDLDRDETVAEHLAQMLERVRRHGAVAGEAHRQHAQVVARGDASRGRRRRGRAQRLRALPTANGSDGWLSTGASIVVVDGHREREPAGEAHADRADARAAALLVQVAGRARAASR